MHHPTFAHPMHRLLLFASGQGSNAEAIIRYFNEAGSAEVIGIVCNKVGAGVISMAAREGINTMLIDRAAFTADDFPRRIQAHAPDLIVLAGFLWKIPQALVEAFHGRIINLHPALLPKYGGKGMWGRHVHEAVLTAGEKESGITVHRVNEHYDEGDILLQARCPVLPGDDASALAARIQGLEHFYLPRCVEAVLAGLHEKG
jgi:phosphoribosylglycinamide formyltransferase-1